MAGHKSATMTWDTYGHLWEDSLDLVADRMEVAIREALADPGLTENVPGAA